MSLIPDYSTVGKASSSNDSFSVAPFITGDTPDITTTPEVVGAGALEAYTVVGRDSSGNIIIANRTTAPAIGVTVYAGDIAGPVNVYRSGCFNPDMLVWDASYDTALRKKLAFEATGTQIFTRAVYTV